MSEPSEQPPEASAEPARPHWLKAVFGFGLASLLSDMGHEAATAAMPLLLASLGAPPAALGVIEGLSDGLSSFAKLAGGWIANQPRWRKPIVVLGYLVTGLSNGAYALATGWTAVLGARGGGWLAKGIRNPARNTMLADAVTGETRGRAFGFHRTMDTLGAVAGPALATWLVATVGVGQVRHVFLWALVPGVGSAVVLALFVKSDRRPVPRPIPFWQSFRELPPSFRRFLGAVFLFGLGDFARTLLILRATRLLAPHAGLARAAAIAMTLYVVHNILYAAAAFPVGWFADRMSPRRLLVVGYGFGVVTAVLAAFATPTVASLTALFVVAGLTLAFEDTLESTIAGNLLAPELRGTGYGVLATANGAGDLVSSSMVGLVWSFAGAKVAFAAAAVLCAAGTVVLALGRRSLALAK